MRAKNGNAPTERKMKKTSKREKNCVNTLETVRRREDAGDDGFLVNKMLLLSFNAMFRLLEGIPFFVHSNLYDFNSYARI